MTPIHFAAIVLGSILAIGILHRATWLTLRLLVRSAHQFSPSARNLGDRLIAHPLHARIAARYPRLYATLHARLRPHPFTGLPLTLMIAAALYFLALLGGVFEDLLMNEGLVAVDAEINGFFGPYRTTTSLAIFIWVTALGAGPAITAVAVTASGFLWCARRQQFVIPLWFVLLGAEATSFAGKYLVGRTRPEFLAVASAFSPSFPSGHATASMAVYGFLAYAIARDLSRARERFEVVFWTAVLILLIGFSRMFLSLHYLSDVVSGFLVGGFWLLVGFAIVERRLD